LVMMAFSTWFWVSLCWAWHRVLISSVPDWWQSIKVYKLFLLNFTHQVQIHEVCHGLRQA
jgi:hypothetical protein